MRYYLVLGVIFLSVFSFSQKDSEDSIRIENEIDSLRGELYSKSIKLMDSVRIADYDRLARLMSAKKDYHSAIQYYDTIINNFPSMDYEDRVDFRRRQALLYKNIGKTDVAIELLLDLVAEVEDKGIDHLSAMLNNRIGVIFLKMGELGSAEYHLGESIEFARKIDDFETEASSLMSMGNRFKKENKFDQAEANYNASIKICEEHGFKKLLAGNYNNFGSLLRLKGQPDESLEYYNKAVEINQEMGNDLWLSYNYNNIGNIYKEKGRYNDALRYFGMSNEIKIKMEDRRGQVLTMQNIALTYELMGNYIEAYNYYKKFEEMKDSLHTVDRVEQSKELAAQFQAERREAEILQLTMQDELRSKEIESKDARIRYFGIGIVLILGIVIILWRSVMIRKKTNDELEIKNEQIDEKNKEIIDSINYAKRIQKSILPNEDALQRLIPKHAILYKPKDIISGDFYICEDVGDNIYFGTVDCTGHGVPGAMVSIIASNSFSKMIHELNLVEPGDILNGLDLDVRRKLETEKEESSDGMDMSVCRLNRDLGELAFSGAFQNCWLFNSKDELKDRSIPETNTVKYESDSNMLIEFKGIRKGIGMSSDQTKFDQVKINVKPGDKILLSTDGFQDQFGGPHNKKFKVSQMREIVLNNADLPPNQLVDTLSNSLKNWQKNEEQVDDICVFIVEV